VSLGRDRDDAFRRYEDRARRKYVAYAARERAWAGSADSLQQSFAEQVADHLVAGTPDDVVAQLAEIARALPVGPLIVRPHWPGMAADEVVAYLDELGREVVPALRELP
jgi:alkanesulfonate monooxygenase SsuD/methylene tetrahydromethanopterin reductase-like flavin-dependent oxidoreductase (luciferase family)